MDKQNQEITYLKVPSDYVCTLNKLIVYLADYGKELIDDCSVSCKNRSKIITNCWNLFQLAVSNKLAGNNDKAEYFIDYIEKQLANISNVFDIGLDITMLYKPIDENGYLKATRDCTTKVVFFVNPDTGYLYKINYVDNTGYKLSIEDNNLLIDYNKYARVYTKSR